MNEERNGAISDASEHPALSKELSALRAQVRENFGNVVLSMMALPRYQYQSLLDLHHLVLDPLIRDRVAIAYRSEESSPNADIARLALWARVS